MRVDRSGMDSRYRACEIEEDDLLLRVTIQAELVLTECTVSHAFAVIRSTGNEKRTNYGRYSSNPRLSYFLPRKYQYQ